MQYCSNSIANALELLQFCIKPSISYQRELVPWQSTTTVCIPQQKESSWLVPHCQVIVNQHWARMMLALAQCTWKTFMVHQTFGQWALYILFKFVTSIIRHLGLAIGNVRWFSWTLLASFWSSGDAYRLVYKATHLRRHENSMNISDDISFTDSSTYVQQ